MGTNNSGKEGPDVSVVLLGVLFLSLECLSVEGAGSEVPVFQVLGFLCGNKVGEVEGEVILVCLEETVTLLAEHLNLCLDSGHPS